MTTKVCNSCKRENNAVSVLCAYCGKALTQSTVVVQTADKDTPPLQPFNRNVHIRHGAGNETARLLELQHVHCSPKDLTGLFNEAQKSSFVSGNPNYRAKVNATTLGIDSTTWMGRCTINGFATEQDIVLAPGASGPALPATDLPENTIRITGPCIVLNEFLLMAAGVASVFLCSAIPASNISKERLFDLSKALSINARTSSKPFFERVNHSIQRADLLCEDAALVESALRVRNGMITAVLAHEMGHLCLGHTTSLVRQDEVSRNMEREADSFAASLLYTLDNRAYHFVGQIMFDLMMTWQHHGYGPQTPTSHPSSRDRLLAAFTSNPTAAGEAEALFGMSVADWHSLLPPEHQEEHRT